MKARDADGPSGGFQEEFDGLHFHTGGWGSPADPSQGQAQPGRCPACDLDASGQTVDLWEHFSGK